MTPCLIRWYCLHSFICFQLFQPVSMVFSQYFSILQSEILPPVTKWQGTRWGFISFPLHPLWSHFLCLCLCCLVFYGSRPVWAKQIKPSPSITSTLDVTYIQKQLDDLRRGRAGSFLFRVVYSWSNIPYSPCQCQRIPSNWLLLLIIDQWSGPIAVKHRDCWPVSCRLRRSGAASTVSERAYPFSTGMNSYDNSIGW